MTADCYKNESIRDSFINGLTSNAIRQRLLENVTLDLQTAYDQARSLDIAQKSSDVYTVSEPYSPASAVPPVAAVQSTSDSESPEVAATQTRCYFCGNPRHPRRNCPARDVTCLKCSKTGHFAKVCNSLTASSRQPQQRSTTAAITLASITTNKPFRVSADVTVNRSISANALIDSGSTAKSFISSKLAQSLQLTILPENTIVRLAASSVSAKVEGYAIIEIQLQERLYQNVRVSVMKNLCTYLILGTDFQARHDKIIIDYGGTEPQLTFCALTTLNIDPPRLFENLSPDCKTVATKSRRHSRVDKMFIADEIESLLEKGVIEPSNSPWRAQVLVVSGCEKRRLVIYYSQTINRFTLLDAYPLPKIDEMVNEIAQYSVISTLDLRSAYHQVPLNDSDKEFTAFEAGGKLYQFYRMPFGVTNGVACLQRIMDKIIDDNKLKGTFAYLDNVTIGGKDQEEHDANLSKFLEVSKQFQLTFNEQKSIISATSINLLGYQISNGTLSPDPERLQPLLALPAPHDMPSLRRTIGMFAYYAKWIPKFSEKVRPLNTTDTFPISDEAKSAFDCLKKELASVTLSCIDENEPFVVETDASDFAIAATLNQGGRPVAFFSRTLQGAERGRSSVEKEAQSIVEAITKWRHYLLGRHFTLVTDQQSVSFMFHQHNSGKIRNDRIRRWRLELTSYVYDIVYRPGVENVGADTFTRVYCSVISSESLKSVHDSMCHPGITRMMHFVRTKNLPYSLEDVKQVSATCQTCSRIKPKFYKPEHGILIKSTQPFERLNLDFKGPLPTVSSNRYILTVVDEYSRFPFAFPCPDVSTPTVIKCLTNLFSIFGMPAYIHSDRGASFMSQDLKQFLMGVGVSSSRTTAYNPQGNGQVERYNGIIWRAVQLSLDTNNLSTTHWEEVLPNALHSVRSLLCTSTNETPHERFFVHQRRSSKGSSIPSWLANPGKVLLKRNVRASKHEPLVDEVDLLEANPHYAHVRLSNGRHDSWHLMVNNLLRVTIPYRLAVLLQIHTAKVDPFKFPQTQRRPTMLLFYLTLKMNRLVQQR